jgi:hypothetical protein
MRELCGRRARKPGSVPRFVTERGAAVIHLGHAFPRASSDDTRKHRAGHPRTLPYSVLLRMGFAMRSASPQTRGALTSPFHPSLADSPRDRGHVANGREVYSLWHFPRGRPHSPLASILPCGARTFLPQRPRADATSDRLSRSDGASVLVDGETATGKRLRALEPSPRGTANVRSVEAIAVGIWTSRFEQRPTAAPATSGSAGR